MKHLDNLDAGTLLPLAMNRLVALRREMERLSEALWPAIQDLDMFIDLYEDWQKEQGDPDDQDDTKPLPEPENE